jgi:hypothetical protein
MGTGSNARYRECDQSATTEPPAKAIDGHNGQTSQSNMGHSGINRGLIDAGGCTRTAPDLTSDQKVHRSSRCGCKPPTSFNPTTYRDESASSSETSEGGGVTIV